jgi:hypothetical protein
LCKIFPNAKRIAHYQSINQISNAFGRSPFRVKAALANGLEPPKVRGRHSAIDEGSEADILQWIEAQAQKCNPVTQTDLRHHCQAIIPFPSAEDGLILSFYVTETTCRRTKVPLKKTLD